MEIHHRRLGPARVWHHEEARLALLSVWTEREPGHGEDADPLVLVHRPAGRGLIAVFDGVGGAGRGSAGRTPDGVERTQAWLAARRLRGLVEDWFVAGGDQANLHANIVARLSAGVGLGGRIRGTIHRELPSTVAAVDFRERAGLVAWDVLWAGDSRCYLVEPGHGLQQLSRDDTECTDALELLVQDPPMTNLVCADREFALNRWRGGAAAPCVLVAATDGFFGYVATPAQFEHVLLDTLRRAWNLPQWGALLAQAVATYTGDDASLAMAALGYQDFAHLRESFLHRGEHVRVVHDEPVRRARDHRELTAAREDSWVRYRPAYERQWPVGVVP